MKVHEVKYLRHPYREFILGMATANVTSSPIVRAHTLKDPWYISTYVTFDHFKRRALVSIYVFGIIFADKNNTLNLQVNPTFAVLSMSLDIDGI